ncbi:MAG: extensin family protein [Novosphingobium sp.]|nr:extensin family protein [Novosphingobium sp.]
MRRSIIRSIVGFALAASVAVAGYVWLKDHPEHDPWAALVLTDPPGWATRAKLQALRGDRAECRAFLERSLIMAEALPPAGEGQCRRDDRQVLGALAHGDVALAPRGAQATCAVDAGLALWLEHGVQPAAERILGTQVARIEHMGTSNCRRIGGGAAGNWSEHATGNAIDIGAFVLKDGRRIAVRNGWTSGDDGAAFLRAVRDSACDSFTTVLSPDYNAAHADHLHLDQAQRAGGWAACR